MKEAILVDATELGIILCLAWTMNERDTYGLTSSGAKIERKTPRSNFDSLFQAQPHQGYWIRDVQGDTKAERRNCTSTLEARTQRYKSDRTLHLKELKHCYHWTLLSFLCPNTTWLNICNHLGLKPTPSNKWNFRSTHVLEEYCQDRFWATVSLRCAIINYTQFRGTPVTSAVCSKCFRQSQDNVMHTAKRIQAPADLSRKAHQFKRTELGTKLLAKRKHTSLLWELDEFSRLK